MNVKRWETCDHGAGAYWLPHEAAKCADCRKLGYLGDYVLFEDYDALAAQLPEGMKHCTIRFCECDKGHGWLTATNWKQYGCPTCERDALAAENVQLKEELARTFAEMADVNGLIYARTLIRGSEAYFAVRKTLCDALVRRETALQPSEERT